MDNSGNIFSTSAWWKIVKIIFLMPSNNIGKMGRGCHSPPLPKKSILLVMKADHHRFLGISAPTVSKTIDSFPSTKLVFDSKQHYHCAHFWRPHAGLIHFNGSFHVVDISFGFISAVITSHLVLLKVTQLSLVAVASIAYQCSMEKACLVMKA